MSVHIASREDVLSMRKKKQSKSKIAEKQIDLQALYSPSKRRIYKLKKCQRLSETRCPSVKNSYLPIKLKTHLNATLSKEPSLKKMNFHSRPLSIEQSKDFSNTLELEEYKKKISLLNNEIAVLKKKLEENLKEKRIQEYEKNESCSSISSSELVNFTENTKYTLDYVKTLEIDLKAEKEETQKYKRLYECEKENAHFVITETLKTKNLIESFSNENIDSDNFLNRLALRNKELYEQVIRLSDIIFEFKLQRIKELTYQRDQISEKLKELSVQINELPEIRKHVLILLNFIQNIKTGLKCVTKQEGDYFDSKKYKEEMSELLNQISTITKSFDFKEVIAKSGFGKGLIGLVSKDFSFKDYILKNNFSKEISGTTKKNRRPTELLNEIFSKLGAFT